MNTFMWVILVIAFAPISAAIGQHIGAVLGELLFGPPNKKDNKIK